MYGTSPLHLRAKDGRAGEEEYLVKVMLLPRSGKASCLSVDTTLVEEPVNSCWVVFTNWLI